MGILYNIKLFNFLAGLYQMQSDIESNNMTTQNK